MFDLRHLFEEFLSLIDKPYDYHNLLCKIFVQLAEGQAAQSIQTVDGVPYFYDPGREKYLSLARPIIQAGAYGEAITNRYLKMNDVASAGQQGFLVFRPATITALAARSRSTSPWMIEVRRNGVALTLVQVTVTARTGYDKNIDIDVDPGDWLQVFAAGSDIEHPVASVEIAWRLPPNP